MSGKIKIVWSDFAPGEAAGRREFFCSAEAAAGAFPDFAAELEALRQAYRTECAERGIADHDKLLLRFHLSDAANQGPRLRELLAGRPASIVDQPPATGSRVALEAWCLADATDANVRVAYSPRLAEGDSRAQMHTLFSQLGSAVTASGGSLADNVLRTWIYCRDVDNNYPGVVHGRNAVFDRHGMTERYLASTGIGGGSDEPRQLVAMDALLCSGTPPEQTPLRALDHLSPTALYGVRFERAMRVGWHDRDWLIVSGTASIDHKGNVLYPGDIRRQSRRVVENIAALLAEGGAGLPDVRTAAVYLRDTAELPIVREVFDAAFPGIPLVYLRAPVCRPAWLVECECLAVRAAAHPDAPEL